MLKLYSPKQLSTPPSSPSSHSALKGWSQVSGVSLSCNPSKLHHLSFRTDWNSVFFVGGFVIFLSFCNFFCTCRYLAICRPLSPLARSSVGEAKKIVLLIWVVSLVSALPWSMFTKVNYLVFNNQTLLQSAWCSIPFNEQSSASLYMMLTTTIIYFFAPMVIVTLLYTKYVPFWSI